MKTEMTRTQRKFHNAWDEMGYLRMKILDWFYGRGSRRRALPFCDRLQVLLDKTPDSHEAIFGQECWSLIYEVRGELAEAIAHREREIEMIKHLHRISVNTSWREFALQGYDYSDWSDRLDLLAILYHDAGNLQKAIQVLKESRRLCRRHAIPFDGEDVLREYLAKAAANGQPRRLSSGKI